MSQTSQVTSTNRVLLRGKVTRPSEERVLPRGGSITVFRISVPREPTLMTRGSRQSADWFDCTAWSARMRRQVAGWRPGDLVEIGGAVRRRFVPSDAGGSALVDIEVLTARRQR